MAASSDTGSDTVRKLVVLCVSITVAINTPIFIWMSHFSGELIDIRETIATETDDRFRMIDHTTYITAHEKLQQAKYDAIYFRFQRNETQINYCKDQIEQMKRGAG